MNCILHTGYINPSGYGYITRAGKKWGAHAWAALQALGPRPPGMVVCHSCDTRACINPAHLRYDTQANNQIDKSMRGPRGSKLRLTPEQAVAIMKSSSSVKDLAAEYGIGIQTVRDVRSGHTWGHLNV